MSPKNQTEDLVYEQGNDVWLGWATGAEPEHHQELCGPRISTGLKAPSTQNPSAIAYSQQPRSTQAHSPARPGAHSRNPALFSWCFDDLSFGGLTAGRHQGVRGQGACSRRFQRLRSPSKAYPNPPDIADVHQ